MSRQLWKLILLAVFAGLAWFLGQPEKSAVSSSNPAPLASSSSARQTWGRIETLPDHFARHGRDFQARDAEDYAAQAAAFLSRAKTTGLPAKRDGDGSIRVFDPATGTFGAYNRDGTTKTFFKPGKPGYFEHQPGAPVDLRTAR